MTAEGSKSLSELAAQHWNIDLPHGFDNELRFIQRKYLPEQVWGDFESLVLLELAKSARRGEDAVGWSLLRRVQKRLQRERDKQLTLSRVMQAGIEDPRDQPVVETENAEELERVREIIGRILTTDEEFLVGRHLMDGLTIRAIAKEMGVSRSTIHRRIAEALKRIRSAMLPRNSESS